jgi:hypothetical protein
MHILLSNRSFNNLFLDKMRDKIYIYNKCLRNIKYIVLFLDHPNEDFPIKPQIDEQFNLRLNTTFRKVFPKPLCKAYINVRYLFIVKPPTIILYTMNR